MVNLILKLRQNIGNRVEYFGSQYIAFGIFGIINYPLYYIIWKYFAYQSYESLALRLFCTFLCILLLLKTYWPSKLKPWLPVYWYLTLMICLPFFFTFMLFKNHGSIVWLMSSNTVLFWLILMVDWVSYIFVFTFGVILAWVLYILTTPASQIDLGYWSTVAAQFLGSFVVVAFFAGNKERIDKEKLNSMKILASSIAHELRTPLASIRLKRRGISKFLPKLFKGYKAAREENLINHPVTDPQLDLLSNSVEQIDFEVRTASTFIDMLLVNVRNQKVSQTVTKCAIVDCIDEALERYPFQTKQRGFIRWDEQNNFAFQGDRLLMVHVLFNLIKNALYHIAAKPTGEGEIIITTESNNKNIVRFRDTGVGIAEKDLNRVFDRFFSKTQHGAGIGLAYCKMVMENIGGDISIDSKLGEFTEVTLTFPKIEDK